MVLICMPNRKIPQRAMIPVVREVFCRASAIFLGFHRYGGNVPTISLLEQLRNSPDASGQVTPCSHHAPKERNQC